MSRGRWIAGWLVLLLALATAALAQAWRPSRYLADRIGKPDLQQLFPKRFGAWQEDARMPVVLPAPDVQAKLDAIYNQVLTRAYTGPGGARLMLSVAYGGDQSDGTRLHRPEVCYPAQGFQLLGSQGGQLSVAPGAAIKVRRLVARLGARHEPITYWVMVGDQVATSATEQKLAQLRYGVRGEIPDGMLIRVSSIEPDPARAYALHERFVQDLAAASSPAARSRLFGDATPR